jgi:hypothetical protein
MEEIVAYLEAIDEINKAERALRGATDSARLRRAHRAAEAAWTAIAPQLRRKLSPPPEYQAVDDYSAPTETSRAI